MTSMVRVARVGALLVLVALVSCAGSASACSCVDCANSAALAYGSVDTVTPTTECQTGQQAIVNSLSVQSTDGSAFSVTTRDTSSSSTYYPALSGTDDTCFEVLSSTTLDTNTVAVQITCTTATGCNVVFNIAFSCSGTATTPTVPTAPTDTDYCTCDCCAGDDCSASIVGYAANSGCSSDCDGLCQSSFSGQCPVDGYSGQTTTYCTTVTAHHSGAADRLTTAGVVVAAVLSGAVALAQL